MHIDRVRASKPAGEKFKPVVGGALGDFKSQDAVGARASVKAPGAAKDAAGIAAKKI